MITESEMEARGFTETECRWNRPTKNERVRARLLNEQEEADVKSREHLAEQYGKVWNTEEAREDFDFLGYAAPFASVRRRSDRVLGTLEFQHHPRLYFGFMECGNGSGRPSSFFAE